MTINLSHLQPEFDVCISLGYESRESDSLILVTFTIDPYIKVIEELFSIQEEAGFGVKPLEKEGEKYTNKFCVYVPQTWRSKLDNIKDEIVKKMKEYNLVVTCEGFERLQGE